MNSKNLFVLEYFPNEILIEIFKYLDIQDLFQAFCNLNFRFNMLLHSLNHLSFTISKKNYNNFNLCELPTECISTLIIAGEVYVDLNRFKHIRCLTQLISTFAQIEQLYSQALPYLEHLSIKFSTQSFPYTISKIINKIFSNGFPLLQSCYLPKMERLTTDNIWSQVLSLRKLTVDEMNVFHYKAILTACPNLYFLKFTKSTSGKIFPSSIIHNNLKIMKIVSPVWLSGEQSDIDVFLSFVPNLEQFSIYHAEFGANMNECLSYDWLSSSIKSYLPLLRRFIYYLEIYYFGMINTYDIENSLSQIKEDFRKVHNDQYQSRLIIIQRF